MIIIFHSLYFLVKHVVKIYRTAKAISNFRSNPLIGEEVRIHTNCVVTDTLDVRFDPPLYKQRYATVQQILLNVNWKSHIRKVVDFGCGQFSFFPYMKHLYDINEIVFVDIDEDILNYNLFRLRPLTVDYLKQRPDQLKVQVLLGTISQPDARLLGCDAIVAIELIEHLYPDTLEALPYNVFHYVKPLLVIFTTPNYEFNVLFPDTKNFRHADHKFEWTREQFESWALNITTRFPNYTVQFDGIGPGPEGSDSVGCCSQVAIFLKHSDESEQLSEVPKFCREIKSKIKTLNVEDHSESHGICTYYSYVKQIREFNDVTNDATDMNYREVECINYPFHVDTRTTEERMLHDIQYKIYSASASSRFYNEKKHRIEYPLYELVSNEEGCFATVPELRKLLGKEDDFLLEECLPYECDKKTLCVIYNLRMEDHSSSPSSDGNSSDDKGTYKIPWNITADESDWETEYNQTVKINDETIEKDNKTEETKQESQSNNSNDGNNNVSGQRVTYQFHGTVPNASDSVEEKPEVKQERNNGAKQQTNSNIKLPSTSNEQNPDKTPKKGTKNIKNKDIRTFNQGTSKDSDVKKRKIDNNLSSNVDVNDKKSYKKNIELKVHDSVHSQGSNVLKSNRNAKSSISAGTKSNSKGKIMTTSSLKRFPTKIDDSSLPSTSDPKKKKKTSRKSDEDKEDMKALTECIVYNTLNSVAEVAETGDDAPVNDALRIKNMECIMENLALNTGASSVEVSNDAVGLEIVDQLLTNAQFNETSSQSVANKSNSESDERKTKEPTTAESANQELNHASREALFDPNSEIDMLEEFEIPTPPPIPTHLHMPATEHGNVILIGFNPTNEEESVVLPDNADPFPNWLLQLLGANVEEGESHDEPHFYCQGDGIGVHPSVIEVEIDEEESSSDSSSSHHEAEAGYTSSDSGVVQLPPDEADESNTQENTTVVDAALAVSRMTPGSTSAAESADEFFDSLEETLTINNRPNSEINRRN